MVSILSVYKMEINQDNSWNIFLHLIELEQQSSSRTGQLITVCTLWKSTGAHNRNDWAVQIIVDIYGGGQESGACCECLQPFVKHGGSAAIIWSFISASGVGKIDVLKILIIPAYLDKKNTTWNTISYELCSSVAVWNHLNKEQNKSRQKIQRRALYVLQEAWRTDCDEYLTKGKLTWEFRLC